MVLNRPSETAVYNVLPQWAKLATKPKTMFIGGPVKRDAALCLATDLGMAFPFEHGLHSTLIAMRLADRLGVEVYHDMANGLRDVDIVMMLRLQLERMHGSFVPSVREYFHFYGLDYAKLAVAKPDALIMHPGPMNRGVEIDSEVADDIDRSVIREQVEMGVAVRMACLEVFGRMLPDAEPSGQ